MKQIWDMGSDQIRFIIYATDARRTLNYIEFNRPYRRGWSPLYSISGGQINIERGHIEYRSIPER